jgi:hypothetical protein
MRTFTTILLLAVLAMFSASAQTNNTENFFIARMGMTNKATYHLVEAFQQRGRWLGPDIGYIDFAKASEYRELFIGGGAVLLDSKYLTVMEEGLIDKATGPKSGNATYFLPWTRVAYRITPKVGGETVYFPYLPLNKAGRIQHVLERAVMEYDLSRRLRFGTGYAAYQFGNGPWESKPLLTATIKTVTYGNFTFWLQRLPDNRASAQIRYSKAWK